MLTVRSGQFSLLSSCNQCDPFVPPGLALLNLSGQRSNAVIQLLLAFVDPFIHLEMLSIRQIPTEKVHEPLVFLAVVSKPRILGALKEPSADQMRTGHWPSML
jgi:hypothetical protein